MISLIAAMAHHRVIGRENQMPWHLPADLAHFKAITLGKPIIMGRKTWDSLGRPLPGRENIVVSQQMDLHLEGAVVFHSLAKALAFVEDQPEIMVIGGASIYQQALPLADKMYLTQIELEVVGDAYFPEWIEAAWQVINAKRFSKDDKNPYDYQFIELLRSV